MAFHPRERMELVRRHLQAERTELDGDNNNQICVSRIIWAVSRFSQESCLE
jgi:hypothetical protein